MDFEWWVITISLTQFSSGCYLANQRPQYFNPAWVGIVAWSSHLAFVLAASARCRQSSANMLASKRPGFRSWSLSCWFDPLFLRILSILFNSIGCTGVSRRGWAVIFFDAEVPYNWWKRQHRRGGPAAAELEDVEHPKLHNLHTYEPNSNTILILVAIRIVTSTSNNIWAMLSTLDMSRRTAFWGATGLSQWSDSPKSGTVYSGMISNNCTETDSEFSVW